MDHKTKQSQQSKLVEGIKQMFEQKGISKDEIKDFLTDVFVKAFNKSDNWDWKNPIEEADIRVNLDLDKPSISVIKVRTVVQEIEPMKELKQVLVNSPESQGKQVGEEIIEVIDLTNLNHSKLMHIKQLLVQKTREAEKIKLHDQFIDKKGKLINAKVFRIEENYAILDHEGTSIFLPKSEMNPLERLSVGHPMLVYVVEVAQASKDAQIIGSRGSAFFVSKLIEQEVDEVINGIIEVKGVAREAGFKTKIAVSSKDPNVDPVGALIGPKGQKIKVITDQLSGERVDVITYSDNLEQFIASAITPAEVIGIVIDKNEDYTEAKVIVKEEQYLSAIGKKGLNVKLAGRLTNTKIDVYTEQDAIKANLTWTKFVKEKSKKAFEFTPDAHKTAKSDRAKGTSVEDIIKTAEHTFDLNDFSSYEQPEESNDEKNEEGIE